MVSEPLIYSRRLASGLRTQKRERETLTLEKRSAKRGGLTFSSACSVSSAPRSRAASTFVGNRGKSDARVSTRGVTAVSFLRDARTTVRSGRDVMHGVQYSRRPIMSCADTHMPGAGKIGNVCSRSGDREDITDREGVADRADVPDREIGKILPIGKVLPIGQMFPIRRSRRCCRSERYCRSAK
jgi:hypothetical protein